MMAISKSSAQPGLEWTFRLWIVLMLLMFLGDGSAGLAMLVVGVPLVSARIKIPQWGTGLDEILSKRYLTQFLIVGALVILLDYVAVTALVAAFAFAFFKSSLVGVSPARANLLVIVDGQCALCLSSVRLLYAARWRSSFRVTEFGSELASRFGKVADSSMARTLEVLEFNELGVLKSTRIQSEAVLRLADECGPVWKSAALIVGTLPLQWRDKAYAWIAKNRYLIKGSTLATCPIEFRQKSQDFFANANDFNADGRSSS